VLHADPEFVLIAERARSVREAITLVKRWKPTLALVAARLPGGGGLEAARELMIESPLPIVIVSDDSDGTQVIAPLEAVRAGALAVVPRPPLRADADWTGRKQFLATLKAMAQVMVVRRWREKKAQPVDDRVELRPKPKARYRLVAIAGSTGGPGTLAQIFTQLPRDFPLPILVVQHIAGAFIGGMIDWLASICPLKVKLAEHGEPLTRGTIYVGPDNVHLGASSAGSVALRKSDPIGGFCPSADHLFGSVTEAVGAHAINVILTGMGRDGFEGLKIAHAAGATIIAQDEASSVVFGMNGTAVAAGLADYVLAPDAIANALTTMAASAAKEADAGLPRG
jgi:two-component system chemotaxis response regulator CheB